MNGLVYWKATKATFREAAVRHTSEFYGLLAQLVARTLCIDIPCVRSWVQIPQCPLKDVFPQFWTLMQGLLLYFKVFLP